MFNIKKSYVLPTKCICVDLRTNSDYSPIQHKLTGLCNRDGVCLLRGTDCEIAFTLGLEGAKNSRVSYTDR
jgi:hypothetical protein